MLCEYLILIGITLTMRWRRSQ